MVDNTFIESITWDDPIREKETKEFLTQNNWPIGLQNYLLKGLKSIPVRFFICDDSGSMAQRDGHLLTHDNDVYKRQKCSRWEELAYSLRFHSYLSNATKTHAQFCLLNDRYYHVGEVNEHGLFAFHNAIHKTPGGGKTYLNQLYFRFVSSAY